MTLMKLLGLNNLKSLRGGRRRSRTRKRRKSRRRQRGGNHTPEHTEETSRRSSRCCKSIQTQSRIFFNWRKTQKETQKEQKV